MKAFEMDDEGTIYSADTAEEALNIYVIDSNIDDPDEPKELSDQELDKEHPYFDEDENIVPGKTITIRQILDEATEPGYLCGGPM